MNSIAVVGGGGGGVVDMMMSTESSYMTKMKQCLFCLLCIVFWK